MRGEPVLEIRDLKIGFSGPNGIGWAVDGLNFDVMKGSWTSLVGRSGSGKSVTALSLTRLIRPDAVSGGIYWFGRDRSHVDLLHADEATLRRVRGREIATIFQDPGSSLNPVLTVGEQIGEVSPDKKTALDSLASLRIEDPERVYRGYPHELSGGMKQRVMIAMALCSGANIIIADEPTTALDPTTQADLVDLLVSLQKSRGLTLLFITHDLTLAKAVSDSVVIIERGRAVPADGEYAKTLFRAELAGVKPRSIIEV